MVQVSAYKIATGNTRFSAVSVAPRFTDLEGRRGEKKGEKT